VMACIMGGPLLSGTRTPLNVPFFPLALAFPTDVDDTAMAYVVLLEDSLIDGGAGVAQPLEQFTTDWRDLGQCPLRITPEWLPPASGVFLTWFNYHDPPDPTIPNDVDVAVAANALYALARYGRLDTPGVTETIALINRVVEQGIHRARYKEVSPYSLDGYLFEFCVTRAYREGPVPALQPAVEILADEIEQQAIRRPDGTNYWNKGEAHLDTAFAVLGLMNAGRASSLIKAGIDFLVAKQDPVLGCWEEGTVFAGNTDTGVEVRWVSRALTTAMAFEALCRYRLAQ